MISPILQMKILRLRGVKPDLQAKSKTLSERDLVWLLSSRSKGAGVGAGGGPGGGPFTRSSCSLSGGGASCQPGGLAAPGCPGKEGARGRQQRVCGAQGCSSWARAQQAPRARPRPPREPGASPESSGRRAAVAKRRRGADGRRVRRRPGAPRESLATSHGARARARLPRTLAGSATASLPRHCPSSYRSCSPVTRTSAMRSSSLCCAPPLPLVLLSLPPLPALLPSSMVGAAPLPLSSRSAAGSGIKSACPH